MNNQLEEIKQKIKNDEYDRLYEAYETLGSVVIKRPELAKEVLNTLKEGLKSEKNNYKSLCCAYEILGDVVKEQPELANEVLNITRETLKYDKNYKWENYNSFQNAYDTLSTIIKVQPNIAKDVFAVTKELIKSDKNDGISLACAYREFYSIAEVQLEWAQNVMDIVKEGLKSDQNDHYIGGSTARTFALYKLYNIVNKYPILTNDFLKIVNEALETDKYESEALSVIYTKLNSVIKSQPKLAKDALVMINKAIKSDSNFTDNLQDAYTTLGSIIQIQPELAKDVFSTFQEGLKSEENDRNSLETAYKILGSIVEAQPELAKDVINAIISADNSIEKICLLSRCMKNCKVEDFPEVSQEQKQELQVAYVMRFSTKEEIKYLYDHSSMDKIAEMRLSAQQRCMNVMMSQLGKEQKLDKNEIIDYRKNPENKTYQDNADWLIPASLKAAELFGCYFPSYIKQIEGHLNTHDSVYWLPEDMGKEKNQSFVSFVQRNLIYEANGEKKCRNLAEMDVIAKNWQYLKPEDYKLKYKDVLAICRSRKYKDQEHVNFAAEAAKWGVTERQYKDWEDVYAAGLKVPEPFDSSKRFEFGNYCGRFLPRDDVRTGFFGEYTNCCQHFDGVGKECAISTIKDPYSQLFVIESKETGKIIAGSWVWENTEGTHRDVCFDNIEAIGEFKKHPMLNHIYDMAGRYLTEEENCRKVTIGMGYQDAETSKYTVVDNIPLPTQYNDEYSDAKGTQVLLAQNPKAQPLDKSQESVRFVREACFLDWDAMDSVSEQCFPDGDQRLQSPERLTGLALVDKDQGVVGYCLYDKDERSIYDMAVLPEYRTDKNASSRKLFAETIKKVKEIGGEWSAELRDKTTYRYMEIMQQRGLVAFKTHGVDHQMSDGSKVYSVTFKVNDTPTPSNNHQQNIHRSGKDSR